MAKLPISIFIITQNEEDRLPKTLAAIKDLTDDIIVVDSGSQDQTQEIAKSYGIKLFFRAWEGFGPQKRYGEQQCQHDWLLNLDADEVITEQFYKELNEFFQKGYQDLYQIGKVKITSVYPHRSKPRLWADYNHYARLYHRQNAGFSNHATWDSVQYGKGQKIYYFKSLIYHYSIRNFSHFIEKENRYTDLQVTKQKAKPYFILILRLFLEFPISFLKAYILRRHFTGGLYGFCLSIFFANARLSRIAKMWETHFFKRKS